MKILECRYYSLVAAISFSVFMTSDALAIQSSTQVDVVDVKKQHAHQIDVTEKLIIVNNSLS
jgi:hypothetical protein